MGSEMCIRDSFKELALLLMLKIAGTALALSSGFAGGVFSPSVFMGAMLGGVFILGLPHLPFIEADQALYSVAGMAAVSSAMLGAPISTILIVFEITRDYGVTLAVMMASAFASTTMQIGKYSSFFRWQLAQRNINITAGRDLSLLRTETVEPLMTQVFTRVQVGCELDEVESQLGVARKRIAVVLDDDGGFVGSVELKDVIAVDNEMSRLRQAAALEEDSVSNVADEEVSDTGAGTDAEASAEQQPQYIETVEQMVRDESISATISTNLVTALQLMAENEIDYLPVISDKHQDQREILGVIFKADVLAAHYSVLKRAREEEFGVN